MTRLSTFEEYILPTQQIRISTFDRVNDPFELLGEIAGGNKSTHDFNWLRKHWTETHGFISFSDNWRSPLMWAHYAENHTGVCLGIDIPAAHASKVAYLPARSMADMDFKQFEHAADGDLFRRIATTKYEQWAYEKEWRIFKNLEFNPKEIRPEFFYESFTPEFELREVILGARCPRTGKEMQEKIFGATATITIKKARAAFGTFDIVEQKQAFRYSVSPMTDFTKKERKKMSADRYAAARELDEKLKRAQKDIIHSPRT